MESVTRRCKGEGGFTLPELLVMVAILGIVTTTSYMGLGVIMKARDVSDRQATYATDIASPLHHMEKIVSQAITVEVPNANSLSVLVDPDNDNVYERHTYLASGGQLVEEIWAIDPATKVNTTQRSRNVWSYNNDNPGNADLFTYRDDENRTITRNVGETDTQFQERVINDAKSVRVRILAEVDGHAMGDAATVFMRNR